MTIRTLLGGTLLLILCVLILIAGILVFYPQWVHSTLGLGPFSSSQIWIGCVSTAAVLLGLFWCLERLFERIGKAGVRIQWRKQQEKNGGIVATETLSTGNADAEVALNELMVQVRYRYGRFWRRKVSLLWVMGEPAHVEQVAPGLTQQHWQEGEGTVLLWGGPAGKVPTESYIKAVRRLRPHRPLDGVVWAVDSTPWPASHQVDEMLRQSQKRDALLGWQAPLYLWIIGHSEWPQQERESQSVGCLLPVQTTPAGVGESLRDLIPAMRKQGVQQMLEKNSHDFLLRLSQQLENSWISQLQNLLAPALRGPSALYLRGLMFSLPLSQRGADVNTWLPAFEWQGVLSDCRQIRGKRIGLPWEKAFQWGGLGLALFWGIGTLLSLWVNQTQILESHQQALAAADPKKLLSIRLRNQLALQQEIARLQYRESVGAPWYSRFGLNQDSALLEALWPRYQINNDELIIAGAKEQLQRAFKEIANLPPGSHERKSQAQLTYDQLKAYLMMTRSERIEPDFLTRVLMATWPTRESVPHALWQDVGPQLIDFYARNLSANPQWNIKADRNLVGEVRQILLRQIGQRNAETTLYQEMLRKVANNYSDLTLMDMVGNTDASMLFVSEQIVPGVFTRQAWEEQVQDAIDQVVNERRDEIDWVLSDNKQPVSAELSPEVLKARLTERYFTDFGNAWLNMVNSLHWQHATSLSEAINQLTLMADVRQSPLVALMNTLAWQGKTGQLGGALADTLVESTKKLIKGDKQRQLIAQASGPRGPLDPFFEPVLSLMGEKEGAVGNTNLSFQAYLTRVTQVRLKLQQITNAPDPQAMTQMLAQTVFQGKAVDLTDTRDYGSLIAASLGQEWSNFGNAVFVQPLELAWKQVLQPASGSLNVQWQRSVVDEWNKAFIGRYPFSSTGSDASLPILSQYLRAGTGRIEVFLNAQLGGLLRKEGNRWVPDPIASQGLTFNPQFLKAINQLNDLADVVFAQGDAGLRFELMPRPSHNVVRTQLTIDGQNLDYFNQMESWQSMAWPGNTYYPGAQLSWRSTNAGTNLYANYAGPWGVIRLLEKAKVAPIDSSRYQLEWVAPDGLPLKYILRTELGEGPLELLKLRNFVLPSQIFLNQ
ncbi:ImcF-related family protein [Xenorhabdus szentirmaii]|uniref:ImcF-related family protein n=1 Tax=Xenorhabdus szentirmaii TaxID=290112 RepID=UPI0032B813F3